MANKILYFIFYPFVYVYVMGFAISRLIKHHRLVNEYHPEMDSNARNEKIVENVRNDIKNLRRNMGIHDTPEEKNETKI